MWKNLEPLREEMNDLSLKVQMATTDRIDFQVKQTGALFHKIIILQ